MGLLNAAKLCVHNNELSYYVKSSAVIDYAWPPIKVLDPTSKAVGGIFIQNCHSYIMDERVQQDIRNLLKKVKIKVEYIKVMDADFIQSTFQS